MKIVLVGLFPRGAQVRGGVEGVVDALARQLASDPANEVHVLAPGGGKAVTVERHGPLTVHRLARPRLPGFLNYWTLERRQIHALLASLRPDVAHFHGCAGWLIGYRGKRVLTVHGIAEKDVLFSERPLKKLRSRVIGLIENAGRRNAGQTILISPYVAVELGGVLGGRQHTIENPIDPVFFEPLEAAAQRQGHLVAVGKICERKNTLGLLRVFHRAASRNAMLRLTVAGALDDEAYVAQCRRFIADHGLEQAVQLVGNLDRPRLAALYRSAAAHVLLSLQETAPMVIAECMACGVPSIAYPICGIPHMIEAGLTGALVDADDEEGAAAAIERVATNADGRFAPELIAAKARERFHPMSIAQRTLAVYRAAVLAD